MNRRTLGSLLTIIMLGASTSSVQDAPFVRDVFNRINGQRNQHHLSTLTYNKTLEKAAQAHAEWMARERKMEHLQPAPASFEGTQGRPTPQTKERRVAYCPRFFAYSA